MPGARNFLLQPHEVAGESMSALVRRVGDGTINFYQTVVQEDIPLCCFALPSVWEAMRRARDVRDNGY
jgi:hypothetical protein